MIHFHVGFEVFEEFSAGDPRTVDFLDDQVLRRQQPRNVVEQLSFEFVVYVLRTIG